MNPTSTGPHGRPDGFATRVGRAVGEYGPLVAGLDPTPALLRHWGLSDDVEGLRRFCDAMLEALDGQVACIKPQAAYFERYGAAGVAVLQEVLTDLRGGSTLSILDAKRSDIGSTLEAYAQAYLSDGAPMAADALTLSPYLGYGSLRPAIDLAAATGRGVFILALTSNPEGAALQHHGDPPVAATILRQAASDNAAADAADLAEAAGAAGSDRHRSIRRPAGHVGVVIGATVGSAPADLGLDLASLGGWILAPGLGAQGAGAEDLAAVFAGAVSGVLPVVSRGLASAGPDRAAVRERAAEWNQRLGSAIAHASDRS